MRGELPGALGVLTEPLPFMEPPELCPGDGSPALAGWWLGVAVEGDEDMSCCPTRTLSHQDPVPMPQSTAVSKSL